MKKEFTDEFEMGTFEIIKPANYISIVTNLLIAISNLESSNHFE